VEQEAKKAMETIRKIFLIIIKLKLSWKINEAFLKNRLFRIFKQFDGIFKKLFFDTSQKQPKNFVLVSYLGNFQNMK
jgi:hypothetical protein